MVNSIDKRSRIASPWILGLYGAAGATFIVAANMARWFGGPDSAWFLFPFAAVLGIVQLLAAMWAYETRDGLATAILGIWGSFWIGYGILNALLATGKLTQPHAAFPALAFWFIALAAITWMAAVSAMMESAALVAVFVLFAAGSTIAAIGEGLGIHGLTIVAGWLFIISAVCAWYTATAMMFEETFGREMLPIGHYKTTQEPSRVGAPDSTMRQAPVSRRAG
jgi:succinate-acetate transporter protein